MSKQGQKPAASGSTADLAARIGDPGFTPPVRRLGELFDLFAVQDDEVVKKAERAVLRIEAQYAPRVASELVVRARAAERPARGRLTHLAGRLAHEQRDPESVVFAWLLEALEDDDPKTRRAAARGLGKLKRTDQIESALASAFDRASNEDDKRPLAMALGKVGGDAARTRLAAGDHGRASVMVDREVARGNASAIDPARSFSRREGGEPLLIWFHTRSGLEPVLEEELGTDFGRPRFVAPGVVEAQLDGPLAKALAIRTATHVGFPLEPRAKSEGDDRAADIVAMLEGPRPREILRAFDPSSSIRFRLEFRSGGHRRATAWRVAELVRDARREHGESPELVNDPMGSPWELVVDDAGPTLKLELVPRGVADERFSYRQDLVAASSHPTIAAALAWVAPRRDDDVVWDPFVGAGAELVERARLGPYRRLIGTDIDAVAVAAARANLERAGIGEAQATLAKADALEHSPLGVTLIITNPPMGRRVQRGTHADLLDHFVAHAGRTLVPGGALVWLVPEPQQIRQRATAAGLEVFRAFSVDMGGFSAELTVHVKRGTRAKPRRIVGAERATTANPQPKPAGRRRGSR